ncbi:hypothetical protein HAX54_021490 [Datura stramonium]|uniref:Uncharacterized protein n=1 Tax=Datura stramonium TaxID=4076 RepID=A0ABS8UU04_DATST|nr:hypothetical protein [Datura stramonium]
MSFRNDRKDIVEVVTHFRIFGIICTHCINPVQALLVWAIYVLVENLADTIENGNRDQHSDALVTELKNQFEKCQQLLTSISGSISSRSMTVEGQKRKKAECEQLLNQRSSLSDCHDSCLIPGILFRGTKARLRSLLTLNCSCYSRFNYGKGTLAAYKLLYPSI